MTTSLQATQLMLAPELSRSTLQPHPYAKAGALLTRMILLPVFALSILLPGAMAQLKVQALPLAPIHPLHWWVDVDAFSSITEALEAIGTKEQTLLVATNQALLEDTMIPSNVTLLMVNDGRLVTGSFDLTLNGPLSCEPRRIFDTSGGGKVVFGSSETAEVHPTWWGPMGSSTLSQAIEASIPPGLPVALPSGTYDLDDFVRITLSPNERVCIRGGGKTTLRSALSEQLSGTGVLDIRGDQTSEVELSGFAVQHGSAFAYQGTIMCVYVEGVGSALLSDLTTTGATSAGVRLRLVSSGSVERLTSGDNNLTGLSLRSSSNLQVTNGEYFGNGHVGSNGSVNGYGISCGTGIPHNENIIIRGNLVRDTVRKGIDVHAGHNIIISNNRVDGFNEAGIYAMNESTTKDVRDIQIIGNSVTGYGDNTLLPGKGQGIRIGAYGASAVFSGSFVVTGNLIAQTRTAINVENPSGGTAPRRVVISNNLISAGSEAGGSIVYFANHGLAIRDIVIANNSLHSNSSSYGIRVRQGESATVMGNTIRLDSGVANKGISVPGNVRGVILGNHLGGTAAYAEYIDTNSNNRIRGNMGHASFIPDQN